MSTALKQFVYQENAQNRYNAIKNYAQNTNTWKLNLLAWQILSLLPTNKEKATLAQSLRISTTPASEWALFSYLLKDEHDEEVLCACIHNLANTPHHPLGNKIIHLLSSHKYNSKITNAILEYIEKTGDNRFKNFLESDDIFIHKNNCSKAILEAFLKLKIINAQAKQLCFEILHNKIGSSSNFYAALFYLFFSANINDVSQLEIIRNKITDSQHIKVFDLCFSSLKPILNGNENQFFETAILQEDPLFIGYGIIESRIETLASYFIQKYAQVKKIQVTNTLLNLRNSSSTKILSSNEFIGINSLIPACAGIKNMSAESMDLCALWAKFNPSYNENFMQSVTNPNHYLLWHEQLNYFIEFKDDTWQSFFDKNLKENIQISMNILFFQIISLQYEQNKKQCEKNIIQNIKKCLRRIRTMSPRDLIINKSDKQSNENIFEQFIDKIYSLCISTDASPKFIKEVYHFIPFSSTSWAFIAIALSAPKLDIPTLNYAIMRELQCIQKTLLNENLDKEDYVLEVVSRFQSIVVGADKFRVQITKPTLDALENLANLIQNILDNVDDREALDNDVHTDWNGQVILDKSILRWNAILQICLNSFLSPPEIQFYEKLLCQGLKSAPHVEKRWVVRALVRIDSDECIKSILYQALNHIDSDFVECIIYELFHSHHSLAKQALIRSISRNNISDKIKLDIIQHIRNFQTQDIMLELKDLLLIRLSEDVELAVENAYTEISKKSAPIVIQNTQNNKINSSEIDIVIKSFVSYAKLLAVESKSALRTAEMIFIQSKDWGKDAVDLSPIVNMYCKSVELILRDTFELYTDSIIRQGKLCKQLETLGYAKMEQDKMQNFEDFIADLPIINTIEYFSKFKLRKMLRAICLYRPGKRFTLDGPKAFALFLLVTARKTCPFSLQNTFNMPFFDDVDLFNFAKQVHSLQDSRNRAIHEGLTWEARDEINNMRKQAYSIIDTCLKIGVKLKEQMNEKEITGLR